MSWITVPFGYFLISKHLKKHNEKMNSNAKKNQTAITALLIATFKLDNNSHERETIKTLFLNIYI